MGPQGKPGEKGDTGLRGPCGSTESSGSVYTHWGRKSCGGNVTTIYQGLYHSYLILRFLPTTYSWANSKVQIHCQSCL